MLYSDDMMKAGTYRHHQIWRRAVKRLMVLGQIAAASLVLAVLPVAPAFADTTISQTITCPGNPALSARVSGQSGSGNAHIMFRAAGQRATETGIQLQVSDTTCLGNGWNVTVQVTRVSFKGRNGVKATARDISLVSVGSPVAVGESQMVDNVNGPVSLRQVGSLDRARRIVKAAPRNGIGTYLQALTLRMDFPSRTSRGTYTATVVVTVGAGPLT